MIKPIPFNKPFIIGHELDYIADAVSRGHLSGDGNYTKLCNRWLEEKLDCNKALLTHLYRRVGNSCHPVRHPT